MKKLILTSILSFLCIYSFSQTAKVEKGKKYYEFYNYYKTIEKFEVLQDKTPDIKKELAYSYFNTGQYNQSEKYFSEIVLLPEANIDDIYTYVKVLMINQKYQEAEIWMEKFKTLAPNDKRAELFASNKGFYNTLAEDKGYFSIKNLDFNNDAQEFSPAFYNNKVVFSSSRTLVEPIKRRWTWNNMPFLDFYIAEIDSSNLEFVDFERFEFNKKYHEGTVAFNKKGDFMIFTTNNYKQKSADGVHKLELYQSSFVENKWTKPIALPFNNPDYSVAHPCLNEDGSILFFASDMPGGVGGVDIYMSTLNTNGSWSNPVNLGKEINTEGNEMFPFYHKNGYLFFASDGRPGLGGLDLFVAKIDNNIISKVQNLGAPVNTNFDDFSMIFDEQMVNGYFCSNRISGKGDDDIYSFKLLVPFFSTIYLKGITVDDKDQVLTNVYVTLFDENNIPIDSVESNNEGKFEFKVDRSKNYNVEGWKFKYLKDNEQVKTFGDNIVYETKLILAPEPEFSLYGLVLDDSTKTPLDSVSVELTIVDNNTKFEKITNEKGEFYDDLNYVNLNDKIKYKIEITKKGYLPFTREFEIVYDHSGQYDLNDFLKVEMHKINIGDNIAKALNVGNIYFDLGKSVIRPDAAKELDKIVKVMNDYPTLVIELGSHSDSRGSATSNQTLSQSRATASANYIKQRISNPDRIYGKGYGESVPFVVNQETHDLYNFLPVGQVLTEQFILSLPTKEQQEIAFQLNRRTEFRIIKY